MKLQKTCKVCGIASGDQNQPVWVEGRCLPCWVTFMDEIKKKIQVIQ